MNADLMARVPVQAIAEPKEWELIREYCYGRKQAVGRFLVEAALGYIRQQGKKGKS